VWLVKLVMGKSIGTDILEEFGSNHCTDYNDACWYWMQAFYDQLSPIQSSYWVVINEFSLICFAAQ
jgi:hypothetical protein